MIALGCCSVAQAHRSLDLPVLITIGASFALGTALHKTGAAQQLAMLIIHISSNNPVLLLITLYLAVSLLTESITNNGAAILMLPVVLQITGQTGHDPIPFVLTIMMAASASFATPLGYQTNLMVYGPGNYSFRDFLKAGLPMNALIGAATIISIVCLFDISPGA